MRSPGLGPKAGVLGQPLTQRGAFHIPDQCLCLILRRRRCLSTVAGCDREARGLYLRADAAPIAQTPWELDDFSTETAAKLRTLRDDVSSFSNQLSIVLLAIEENQAQLDGLAASLDLAGELPG